jgi:acetyltransferase
MTFAARTAPDRLLRICHSYSEGELALVAEGEDQESGERRILGVGRLNRLEADGEAGVAVLVSDQYQLKVLGTELVRQPIKAAREKKLRSLVAEMLNDNLATQNTLRKLGFRLRLVPDKPEWAQAVLEL